MKKTKHLLISVLRPRILLLLFILTCRFSVSAVTLQVGERYTLRADAPYGWNTGFGTWECDNPAVILYPMGESCMVYPDRYFSGSATVTCQLQIYKTEVGGNTTFDWVYTSFTVYCQKPTVSLSPSVKRVKAKETVSLNLRIGNIEDPEQLTATWSFSDEDVACIYSPPSYFILSSETLDVHTFKPGTCTITVDFGDGITDSSEIIVEEAEPTAIWVYPSSASMAVGETKQLSYSLTPTDASTTVTWSSDAPDVADVTSTGMVYAYAPGKANITALTDNGYSDQCEIIVSAPSNDLTERVGISSTDWHAGGMVTWAGPKVTTSDGRETALAETYEETTETTGTMMEQTVTGLDNAYYRVVFYANACYTPDRGFPSDITEGQMGVVYLFANSTKQYIPVHIAESITVHGEYTLYTFVTDGTLHLGMVAETPGTNWHSIQIKQLFKQSEVTGVSEASPLNEKGKMRNGEDDGEHQSSEKRGEVYDLQGRKLDGVGAGPVPARLHKGLYIINGKKVMIK